MDFWVTCVLPYFWDTSYMPKHTKKSMPKKAMPAKVAKKMAKKAGKKPMKKGYGR